MNDNKNRIFFITLFTLVLLSAGATFIKYMVLHDYEVVQSEPSTEGTSTDETGTTTE